MTRPILTRRHALAATAAFGSFAIIGRARAAQTFKPAQALLDAARKEGRVVVYTASFIEVMQEVVNDFNKRFPFIKVEVVRAPGGQLITRIQTEAAAGKLVADVVDHSDRALMKRVEDLFQDYAPPNAADYLEASRVSPKLWPTITPCWIIASHSELQKNPPKTWWDLCKPEYAGGQIGTVIAPSGGTTWARIMFERQVLGEDYWAKQAATKPRLYPSGAPLSDALVRGEVTIAPLLYNAIFPKKQQGAPVDIVFPPEGIPVTPYASGIPKTAQHPNAARLFLDYLLSEDGQTASILEQGNLTSLKVAPALPAGIDPKKEKIWVPDFAQSENLRDSWLADWNKVYGYRQ